MSQYRVPVLERFTFQMPVLDKDLVDPPVSPNKGDRYIVPANATGDWLDQEGKIAWYDGTVWQFDPPQHGCLIWVADEEQYYFMAGNGQWQTLKSIVGVGDMLKSEYDTEDNGIVDAAQQLSDGVNVVTAEDAFDKSEDTLDDVSDGTTYGKTKVSELEAGQVKQVRAVIAEEDLSGDDIKVAVDKQASYDALLKALIFEV